MKKIKRQVYIKSLFWFIGAGLFLISAVMGSFVSSLSPGEMTLSVPIFGHTREAVKELERLGLLKQMPSSLVSELIDYQWQSGQSLAEILQNPDWCRRLGYKKSAFNVTWYLANPFEVLPLDLRKSLQKRQKPFKTEKQIYDWLHSLKAQAGWRQAIHDALIETTPENLWRAANGQRPYANNGEYLEPIVIDHGNGALEIRDGHIATDPAVIPTNSEVLLVVKIDGHDRILKVKAADVGGAVKGRHVDLPFIINPTSNPLPDTMYPKFLRNPFVQILVPVSTKISSSPDQKG